MSAPTRRASPMKASFGAALLVTAVLAYAGTAAADGPTLFIRSAVENGDGTVTLPLYGGTSHGKTVYYIVLDTSSGSLADALGVNRSQKLAVAPLDPRAVQRVTGSIQRGTVDFPASVDFSPAHFVAAPGPFPPAAFQPGAVGDPGYSPLVQFPDGLSHDAVNSLLRTRDDSVWVCTDGGGLDRIKDGRIRVFTARDGLG